MLRAAIRSTSLKWGPGKNTARPSSHFRSNQTAAARNQTEFYFDFVEQNKVSDGSGTGTTGSERRAPGPALSVTLFCARVSSPHIRLISSSRTRFLIRWELDPPDGVVNDCTSSRSWPAPHPPFSLGTSSPTQHCRITTGPPPQLYPPSFTACLWQNEPGHLHRALPESAHWPLFFTASYAGHEPMRHERIRPYPQ